MLPNEVKLNGASPMKSNQRYQSSPHKKTTGFYTDGFNLCLCLFKPDYSNFLNFQSLFNSSACKVPFGDLGAGPNCSPYCFRNSNICNRCRCVRLCVRRCYRPAHRSACFWLLHSRHPCRLQFFYVQCDELLQVY